jgi:small basic protein (TIGR04137 family)
MGAGYLYIRALYETENQLDPPIFMSQHNSLKSGGGLVVKRNVLKRFERVDLLKKRGQWKEGARVMGLRKTKPEV